MSYLQLKHDCKPRIKLKTLIINQIKWNFFNAYFYFKSKRNIKATFQLNT